MTCQIEQISPEMAQELCRKISIDLPEYFGLPKANERYVQGMQTRLSLAAKIDETYVGLLTLEYPYPKSASIYWMGVFRKYHGQGVGHKLVEEACKLAKKNGATAISVETLSQNEADENFLKTYQFYESCGFSPLFDLKPEGYEWSMVYMVKNLD